MQISNRPKAIAIVTTVLMAASIIWLMSTKQLNNSLSESLDEERLKSETLLSEKLFLEKDIEQMKEKVFELRDKNYDLDKLAKTMSEKLKSHENEFNRLKKENASISQIKKQRQQLTGLKNQLENELQVLKSSHADLEARNSELMTTVATLQDRNNVLTDDLNKALFASIDRAQLEAVKGKNERLTVKARRTDKLMANFEVPSTLGNISFRVVDPKGDVLARQDGTISFSVSPSESTFVVSADSEVVGNKLQRVEMEYSPKRKLESGIYTVEILNDNLYVSSLKIKLR